MINQPTHEIPDTPATLTMTYDTSFRGLKVWQRCKRQLVYLNHLDIALGSQGELEVQLEIAQRVGILSSQEHGRIQPMSLSEILCVGHNMRSPYAPQIETRRGPGADSC